MDSVLALRASEGRHAVLRLLPTDGGAGATGLVALNRLILAKNLPQLMDSIDELGPIALEPVKGAPRGFAEGGDRVLAAGSALGRFRAGAFLPPDEGLLESELLIDRPGGPRTNVSALRRAAHERGAVAAGLPDRLEEAGEAARVSVEPLRDWLDLRNGLALAARLVGFMTNPPSVEDVSPEIFRDAPFTAAGFEQADGQFLRAAGPSPSTSGRMCLSVELREGEGQAEAARRYLEAEFHAWLGPTVALDEGLELAVAPTPVGTGLATALWRMLAQRSEWEIAVCPNCGSAFLRPTTGYRSRKRLWCEDSCRKLYDLRKGPGAWFAPFAGLVGGI